MSSTNAGGQRPCDQLSMSRFSSRRRANKRNIQTRINIHKGGNRDGIHTRAVQDLSLSISLFFATVYITPGGKVLGSGYCRSIPLIVGHTLACFLFALFFSNFKKERHLGFCRNSLTAWLYTHIYISLIPPSVLVFFPIYLFFSISWPGCSGYQFGHTAHRPPLFLSSKISCFFFFFFFSLSAFSVLSYISALFLFFIARAWLH